MREQRRSRRRFSARTRLSTSVAPPQGRAFFRRRRAPILRAMSSSSAGRSHAARASIVGAKSIAALSFGAALLLALPTRALGPRDRHLSDARHGVSEAAPAGWSLSLFLGFGVFFSVLFFFVGGRF